MKTRIIAGGIIYNQLGETLLLRMADHGVYPKQWGLVGGGMEDGEKIMETLQREMKEETGLELINPTPFWFFDEVKEKRYKNGLTENVYMIYLLYEAKASTSEVKLNDEWVDYAWVRPEKVGEYDLNDATIKTFKKKGWIKE